jgi:hypothetical protein
MTWDQPLLAVAAFVDVVINGVLAPTTTPAQLVAGRVVAPVEIVTRIARSVVVDARGRSLVAMRADRTCAAAIIADAVVLAPLARCLGADIAWDPAARVVAIAFLPEALRSHPPFDASAPQVVPTVIFTPEPAPPTPRAVSTGVPRPRRTPIPIGPGPTDPYSRVP